jgi:hypothetical protein
MSSWKGIVTLTWAFGLFTLMINSSLIQAATSNTMTENFVPCKSATECALGMWCLPNPVLDDGSDFCDCHPGFGYTRKLPTPKTPLYTLNVNDYCEVSGTSRFFGILLAFNGFYYIFRGVLEIIHLIRCMKKAKVWVNNVATRVLIFSLVSSLGAFIHICSILFGTTQLGPSYFFLHIMRTLGIAIATLFMHLAIYEVVVAWIDLVQKTATLSRATAPTLTFAKYFIRGFLSVYCVFTIYCYIVANTDFFFAVTLILDVVYLIASNLSGRSIRRLLLPDPDDKSHANYPAAESIKTYYSSITKAFSVLIFWYLSWNIFFSAMPTIGVAMMFIQYMWESPFMIVIGVIVQYIKVRHKDKNSMRRAFFSLSTKSFHAELIVASIQ